MRNYHHEDKWLPGVVQHKTGPVSYRVKPTNGKTRCCHQDQVHKCTIEVPQDSYHEPDIVIPSSETSVPSPTNTESSNSSPISDNTTTELSTNSKPASSDPVSTNTDAAVVNPTPTPEKSYLKRNRAPVVRFEPTWT